MTQYQFSVNGSSVTGAPTWNPNGTLQKLAITDPFNSANQQTCTYGYDDLARAASVNCLLEPSGTQGWGQTFTPDAFRNLTKTATGGGATSFQPTYSTSTNRISSVGGQTYVYDANGNLTSTGTGTGSTAYTWDAEGKMISVAPYGSATVALTYDALGRAVEQYSGGVYTQEVYDPLGNPLGFMQGQTYQRGRVALVAGAGAQYLATGVSLYRHPDWLGSVRLSSTPSRTVSYDGAYAPYGESYAETGSTDEEFTGQRHDDTVMSLYDFPFREYNSTQGRWLSPDPLGGDITNPQSLDRYAYVMNNPTSLIDPLGLQPDCDPEIDPDCCDPWDPCLPYPLPPGGGGGGGGEGGGGSAGGGNTPPADNPPSNNWTLGTNCLKDYVITQIQNALLNLFNERFGADLHRNDPGVTFKVSNGGTVTLTVDQPAGTPVTQIPYSTGTPILHPYDYEIRPSASVPVKDAPGDYGHLMWNLDQRPNTVFDAQAHMDIGTFGITHPRALARHAIRAGFEILEGDVGPGCAQKFADFGMF
jgi:RHS repeat-associated protein